MRRNMTYKSGHLDIKLPVKMRARGFRGWKAWKRRWIVLHRLHDMAAGSVIITLDLYHNSCGERQNHLERATIYLEDALHLQRVVSRSHPYAFYIEARDTAVYLAAECETDTQEWMAAICQVFWPRPNLPDDAGDVFDAAVTDSAFCNLFGVHGGFCHVSLINKDYLLLQCVYTQHVLLEWPLTSIARVCLDCPIHLRDRGRLFVIEPRPHTSGWTTPLHFFSMKAHLIVESIYARMQGLANASKSTRESPTVRETQTLNRRCTSFYDQPLPIKCKQNRRISDMSHYDTPKPEIDSIDISLDPFFPPRKRSHSESYLAHTINISTNSLNATPSTLTALSYNQLDAQNTDEDEPLPDAQISTFLSSKDSGFQADEYAKVIMAKENAEATTIAEEVPKLNIKPRSEPLYEELDRLHKDINKLLGIDIDDEVRPPPLPPRCPSVPFLEAQKKDVVRFLGMEDPLARRIVRSQQATARQMNQGVKKKNLFYFLGIDGIHSSSSSTGLSFENSLRPESSMKTQQNRRNYENNFFKSFPLNENVCIGEVEYDVPIPIGFKYELFAVQLVDIIMEDVRRLYQKQVTIAQNVYCNLDLIRLRDVKIYKSMKLSRKRFEVMKKFSCVQFFSTTIFCSVLYYSWLVDFYKLMDSEKEFSTNKLRKYVLISRVKGWCHQSKLKRLTN